MPYEQHLRRQLKDPQPDPQPEPQTNGAAPPAIPLPEQMKALPPQPRQIAPKVVRVEVLSCILKDNSRYFKNFENYIFNIDAFLYLQYLRTCELSSKVVRYIPLIDVQIIRFIQSTKCPGKLPESRWEMTQKTMLSRIIASFRTLTAHAKILNLLKSCSFAARVSINFYGFTSHA